MALSFLRSRNKEVDGDRIPPNQKVTEGFPVFTYGNTPRIDTKDWTFGVVGAVAEELSFSCDEFRALPQTTIKTDIHCVTGWSKLDTTWEGVAFRDLMELIKPKAEGRFVMVHCYGGYTTNLPLDDLMEPNVLFAHHHNGEPLDAEHGGPCRLVVPHLYFWKSAKWVRGIQFVDQDNPGFWEQYGYHMRGDPWKEERNS